MWSPRGKRSAAPEGVRAHTQLRVATGWTFRVSVAWWRAQVYVTEVAGAQQNAPALSRTHSRGSRGPLQLTLGLGCSATRDCFRNRRGKRRERPARVGLGAAKQAGITPVDN